MTRFTKLASIFALAIMVLALPSFTSAQWRDRDRDDDYYGRNGRNDDYYGNGRYNGRNIRGTIESLKNRARNFERQTDQMDKRNDRWGGRNNNRYGTLEDLADRFAKATDRLADAYGRGRNMNNSRDEARRVLDIGSQIENVMYGGYGGYGNSRGNRGNRNGNGQWNQISRDLQIIANAYGLNSYNNGGRNRNTDWRNRIPFPLPF